MEKTDAEKSKELQKNFLENDIHNASCHIKEDPHNTAVYCERGWAYGQQGKFKKALLDFDKAIKIDPRYSEAYKMRAITYFHLKKYNKSWRDVFMLIELVGEVPCELIKTLMGIAKSATA